MSDTSWRDDESGSELRETRELGETTPSNPSDLDVSPRVHLNTEITPPGSLPDFSKGSVAWEMPARLQQYVILGPLGKGGFGKVLRARDEGLSREVAIKFLNDVNNPLLVKLFEREARVIAALGKHPSVVQIFEWGEYNGCPYFVLELMDTSAEGFLSEHPEGLSIPDALGIVAECAGALAFAHEKGVLHRDVKPANILMDKDGQRPKLADFGLAKFRMPESDHTVSGSVSGSPPYMSPEQASGGRLDARSDVFSLGVTLYKLLCNRLPFEGSSAWEIMDKIAAGKLVPLEERKSLPPEISGLVMKAIAHRPEDRYQSAAEFEAAVRSALGQDVAAQVYPHNRARGGPWRLVAMFAAGAMLVGGLALLPVLTGRPSLGGKAYAEARVLLDSGEAAKAEEAFRTMLGANPESVEAAYGLAFALLRQGKPDEVAPLLTQLPESSPLAAEVRAADAAARGEAPDATALGPEGGKAPYVRSLAALALLAKGEHAQAAALLEGVNPEQFQFAWQYVEAQQTLGQAHLRLQQPTEALAAFQRALAVAQGGQKAALAAYARQASLHLEEESRKQVIARAEQLRTLLESQKTPAAEAPGWASRPLVYFVLPPDVPANASAALTSGLADLLPQWLVDELSRTPMQAAEREIINDVLAEQLLVANVGERGSLALQQILGARIILRPRIRAYRGVEDLSVDIIDAARATKLVARAGRILPGQDGAVLAAAAAEAVWQTVRAHYPLRAMLYREQGAATLNIGSEAGAAPGMRFEARMSPQGTPVPNVVIQVEAVSGTTSSVEVIGAPLESLPEAAESGWFAQQIVAEPEATAVAAPSA